MSVLVAHISHFSAGMAMTVQQLGTSIAAASTYIADQAALGLAGLDINGLKTSTARSLIAQVHQTSGVDVVSAQQLTVVIAGSCFDAADKSTMLTTIAARIGELAARAGVTENVTQLLLAPENFLPQSVITLVWQTTGWQEAGYLVCQEAPYYL